MWSRFGSSRRCTSDRGFWLSFAGTAGVRCGSGDVRHIVATPAGASELPGFRAVIDPHDGLREFAYAPLRS
jgi:hypothetical protein